MKHIYRILIVLTIGFVGFSILNYKITSNKVQISNSLYNTYNEIIVKNNIDDVTAKTTNIEVKEDKVVTKEEKKVETKVEEKKEAVEPTYIETIIGSMSGYGHDCYGCTSGRTSSGYDISDGSIYYKDNTYGDVRIVAADSKYPIGTIIRISNYNNMDSFYAIVLDRGGSIGLSKKINFDLLYSSDTEAVPIGIQYNVTFDIVRLGY